MKHKGIQTQSGSVYEIDEGGKRARRMRVSEDGGTKFTPLGEWRKFVFISQLVVGSSVLIAWVKDELHGDFRVPVTITTPLTELFELEAA